MKHLKKTWRLLLLISLIALLSACGQSDSSSSSSPSNERGADPAEEVTEGEETSVNLVLGHSYTENDFRAVGYQKWAEMVEERSNGSITIEIFPNGTLVPLPEGYDAVSSGTIDLYATISNYISPMVPEVVFLDPYAVYDVTKTVDLNEATLELIDEILSEHNIKYLGTDYQGPSQIASMTPEPLVKPEDWKGLKFRDAGPEFAKVIDSLGASSTTIPLGELPTAISTGVIDAVAQGFAFIKSLKYYEIMDSIALLPNTANSFGFLMMSMDSWNKLSSAQQEILSDTFKEALPMMKELGEAEFDEIVKLMDEEGTNYHILTPEEEAVMQAEFTKFFDDIYDNLNDRGKELYDIVAQFR